jgi:peptidoglycan/xylan/chitin deacetylase (PgdA/CDA1 family)
VPATIFLATSAIDNRQKLWHDRIFDAFRFAKDGGGRLVLRDIIREAKSMCSKERLGVVERVEETLAPEVPVEFRSQMLSWTQVTDMHRAGIRFGSHTCTHPILSREEPQEVLRELHESKAEIEERLGTRTALLAYPNGQKQDFSSEIEDTVRKVGYKSAFTTLPGYNTADDNAYALKRGKPWQNELNLFRLHLFLQRLDHRR